METITQQVTKKEASISKIVDKVLTQIFGEEATQLIYKHLESNHFLKRDEIAEKIDVFAKGLEEFLRSGAYVIERKILEDIYSDYGLLRRMGSERTYEKFDFVGQMRSFAQRA